MHIESNSAECRAMVVEREERGHRGGQLSVDDGDI